MTSSFKLVRRTAAPLVVVSATVFVTLFLGPSRRAVAEQEKPGNQEKPADPWSSGEILRAADLAQELTSAKGSQPAAIVYVGFHTLFEGGHIPGAVFRGTASTEKGIAELKAYLQDLPRSTHLVIYCGCCPFDHCPNIRPAYKAVHDMGFEHVRVLVLPTSFAADWVEKGYPIDKGL
jgi:thiosulfate/3-mercaptopyruvate sulfurtransferase